MAIGAFNVHNMEYTQAVVQAAEATRMPVILMHHGPGQLDILLVGKSRTVHHHRNAKLDTSPDVIQLFAVVQGHGDGQAAAPGGGLGDSRQHLQTGKFQHGLPKHRQLPRQIPAAACAGHGAAQAHPGESDGAHRSYHRQHDTPLHGRRPVSGAAGRAWGPGPAHASSFSGITAPVSII